MKYAIYDPKTGEIVKTVQTTSNRPLERAQEDGHSYIKVPEGVTGGAYFIHPSKNVPRRKKQHDQFKEIPETENECACKDLSIAGLQPKDVDEWFENNVNNTEDLKDVVKQLIKHIHRPGRG